MANKKTQKNGTYCSRYQVKFRRRREGKTDYQARRALTWQSRTKYNSPKWRFVVRSTNRCIICQLVTAEEEKDRTLVAAYSTELAAFGVKFGFTNYAAAYATGLLCARRALKKVNLDTTYLANTAADGKDFNITPDEKAAPFKAILDVGLQRTSTGARLFGALKGAVDGGILIPHSNNRFYGFDDEVDTLDVEAHKAAITGKNVADFYASVLDGSSTASKSGNQFSAWVKAGVKPADVVAWYTAARTEILKNPDKRTTRSTKAHKTWKAAKTPYAVKRNAINQKIDAYYARLALKSKQAETAN